MVAKARLSAPTWEDLKKDKVLGPRMTIKQDPITGRTEAWIKRDEPELVGKHFHGITNEWRGKETDNGSEFNSRIPEASFTDGNGFVTTVPVHNAASVERKMKRRGLKPVIKWGRPTHRWVCRQGRLEQVF